MLEACSEASSDAMGRFHPSALFFTFSSLNPFTSYKLRVKATNDIGDSDFSAETEAVTTLQDGKWGGEACWRHHRGMGSPQQSWLCWAHRSVFSAGTVEGKLNSQWRFVHRRLVQVVMRCGWTEIGSLKYPAVPSDNESYFQESQNGIKLHLIGFQTLH